MNHATSCIDQWITPLRPTLPDLTDRHIARLARLESDLTEILAAAPVAGAPASVRLLAVRHRLAERVRTDNHHSSSETGATRAMANALAGFVCGFHDLDLRDAVGPGHGRMILKHATEPTRRRWRTRLAGGDLVGIAATERHGGSRLQEITTRATAKPGGGWWISGEKCWVSRLTESAAFVVFFKNPEHRITAAVVEAQAPGLDRSPITPSGLAGWNWGTLALTDVPVGGKDLLGGDGGGLEVFRQHFAAFRPLVAATALGTAASAHTQVAATLTARAATGLLPRLRDTALVTLGRTHAEINAALLSAIAAMRLTASGSPHADLWSREVKAHAVDTAHRALQELPLLVGAGSFRADSALAKARADVGGLLYADGIHDSLLRSAGRTHTTPAPAEIPRLRLAADAGNLRYPAPA
ncbi:acyl-CoA dehydrogenase family protein [Streptomyces sp. NPDC048291]|uniref:acyl-CoA dehydrogenase family protein n=1 Tax=Streptomyces sp. NPDC048291 TaxID=3365530 RepID=UPI00372206C3